MKKYIFDIIIGILQFVVFYIYPIFAIKKDPIGMVMLMLAFTFVLSFILGIFSKKKIKFVYPVIYAIMFIPTVFIYYNESAMIHSIWYLTMSLLGIFAGTTIQNRFKKVKS